MADISGYLNNIRSAESGETVRDSIIQCLNKINNDNPNKTKPLNVTANGTYTSETGYSYNPVTVNVPAGGASNYTFEELEVTENGEYEPEEDNTMYKKVTVNVPQLANDLAPDGYTITQNGEYDPLLDGYDGYGKIIVNVNEATGEGPFTVTFYGPDKVTPIKTETVVKYGSAECTALDGTTYQGQWFKGWNPPPTGVTRDLKCYPVYGDIIIDPTEIQDDWETICAKAGADYPIGAHKSLYIEVPEQYWVWNDPAHPETPTRTIDGKICVPRGDINNFVNIARTGYLLDFVKVAQGESGSTSTWLTKGLTYANVSNSRQALYIGSGNRNDNAAPGWGDTSNYYFVVDRFDWGNSAIRLYLNEKFLPSMPQCLQNSIKAVTKTYYGAMSYRDMWPSTAFKQSSDRIWIPSMSELKSVLNSKTLTQAYPVELSTFQNLLATEPGVDYTANYDELGFTYFNDENQGIVLRDYCNGFYNTNDGPGAYQLMPAAGGESIGVRYSLFAQYFAIGFCL